MVFYRIFLYPRCKCYSDQYLDKDNGAGKHNIDIIIIITIIIVGRDSLVGIATRYGLDGSGIESRWGGGARYSASIQAEHRDHPASYTMCTGSFPGVKRPGRGVEPTTPSSAEVKERVKLYLYSPSGPSWPVIG
jgi:hypothetical protein